MDARLAAIVLRQFRFHPLLEQLVDGFPLQGLVCALGITPLPVRLVPDERRHAVVDQPLDALKCVRASDRRRP